MHVERTELQSGVYLNYIRTDRFKTGCLSFNLLRPLELAAAAPNALIPSVLLRGCRNYPDIRAISQRLDDLYGSSIGTLIRKKGEVQTVGMYVDFLEDRFTEEGGVFGQTMDFLRQLIHEPCTENGGFLQEALDGERLNLVNAIDARVNDKRGYAITRMVQSMCRGEAYAVPRIGEKETLIRLTGEELLQQWRNLLATSQMEFFYMGQQEQGAVAAAIGEILAEMPRRSSLDPVETKVLCPDRPVQEVVDTMDVTQGKLTMGFRTGITLHDPRYPAMMLLNVIYGAGMTSKLFLKIREEQSLCYYANSSVDKFKGVMVVGSGIEFQNYEIARDGILTQLDLCRKGEITAEELESARNYLISALKTGNDSPGRLDDYTIGQAIAGLHGSLEDLMQQVQQVTMDQVVEAANSLKLDTVYFLKGAQG